MPLIARDLARAARDEIRRRTPVGVEWVPGPGSPTAAKVVSGRLRRSIQAQRQGIWARFNIYRWTIETDVYYARFVEYGTRPHLITPKEGELAFRTVNGVTFAEQVHHPGTKPVYMFQKGIIATRPRTRVIARPHLERWASQYRLSPGRLLLGRAR